MNLAVAAALYYRWHLGAPIKLILIAGTIMFLFVNGLILITAKRSASTK
jgi:hypothetical protein